MKNFDLILKVNLIFLVFIANIFSSIAANWELFPPDTKYWCKNQDGRIFSFMADSVISYNYYMLNTKNHDSLSLRCFDSIYRNCYECIRESSKPAKIKVFDSTQLITFGFEIFIEINPYMEVNTSQIQKMNQRFLLDDITISCKSASIEEIYGFQDSVKEFTINFVKKPAKTAKFKISKNYGILSFFYPKIFENSGWSFEEFSVVGYQSYDFHFGYQSEDITKKLLNWNVGDIRTVYYFFNFEYHYDTELYLDSVIKIEKTVDKTTIHFKRSYLDSNRKIIEKGEIIETYNINDFQNYFNEFNDVTIPGSFGYFIDGSYSIYFNYGIIYSKEYGLDSSKILSLYSYGDRLDPLCEIGFTTDNHRGLKFALGLGLVNTSFDGLGYNYYDLQGYRQGDKTWGRISLTTDVDDNESSFEYIAVSPNPATDFITIDPGKKGLQPFAESDVEIEIYDILGFKVISEPIHPMTSSHRMNIEKLPAGVYFVKIGGRIEKIVKM